MLSKNDIKYYSSLLQKKQRKEEKKFIIDGKRIVEEGLKSSYECELVIVSHTFTEDYQEYVTSLQKSYNTEIAHSKDFEKLSDTQNPQGIAAVFKIPDKQEITLTTNLVAAMEEISDPGNTGTILRNCDWFGIQEVFLGEHCVELFNPKVLRASMGSIFHLKIHRLEDNIKTFSKLKQDGYKLVVADMNGENIFNYKSDSKSIITFCNEAFGPSPELLNIADHKVTIPKFGDAESLNVACASAVILAELTKLP